MTFFIRGLLPDGKNFLFCYELPITGELLRLLMEEDIWDIINDETKQEQGQLMFL